MTIFTSYEKCLHQHLSIQNVRIIKVKCLNILNEASRTLRPDDLAFLNVTQNGITKERRERKNDDFASILTI